jgi:hypothetical protein
VKQDTEKLRLAAIAGIEKELQILNDFAENEGYPNVQVMLAVTNRIAFLEKELEVLKREDLQDYELVWHDFWKNICAPNGVINMDQVKRELADYKVLLEEVPKVYEELAGISKPNTPSNVIIDAVREKMIEKDIALSDIKDMARDGMVKIEDIEEYLK